MGGMLTHRLATHMHKDMPEVNIIQEQDVRGSVFPNLEIMLSHIQKVDHLDDLSHFFGAKN